MPRRVEILLVDDERRSLDALVTILEDPGYELLRAEDADTALRLLLKHDVAAIVLDIKMPGISGIELAAMIKSTRRFRETPLIFLTAYMLDERHVVEGYGAGAVDYLTKPVNADVLRHKVAVFADLYRKTRDLAELNDRLEERVRERTTELARSEAALREAASNKDQFLAVLAHELRNPLAPLRTGLHLLTRRLAAVPDVHRTLAVMNRQLEYMVRLIDDLLDVSRLSRGSLELRKETLALGPVIQSAIDGTGSLIDGREQRLSVELDGEISAHIDPTRIAQIVTNLLHNASKFTPDGGEIGVSLRREGPGAAVVRVRDSGPGISSDEVERIFGMFSRLERPGARPEAGLGIGLALARRLAEMHDGSLIAEDRGTQAGAVFRLEIPLAEGGRSAGEGSTSVAVPANDIQGLDVVLVEDNPDVSSVLVDLLEDLGHRVSLADNGESAIALIKNVMPRVVFCDLGLPGTGGLEICQSVVAMALKDPPVMVALTGWGRAEDRRRTKEAGFDHHMVKPISLESLLEILRRTSVDRKVRGPFPPE